MREDVIHYQMDKYVRPGDIVVHGAARGADTIAGRIARHMGLEVREYPADWERHGKAAGSIRNQLMLDKERPGLVLAFPGSGPGTWDMVRRARKAGVPVVIGNSPEECPWDSK